jgi:hypothetical protein
MRIRLLVVGALIGLLALLPAAGAGASSSTQHPAPPYDLGCLDSPDVSILHPGPSTVCISRNGFFSHSTWPDGFWCDSYTFPNNQHFETDCSDGRSWIRGED